jgi:hypothetical protein
VDAIQKQVDSIYNDEGISAPVRVTQFLPISLLGLVFKKIRKWIEPPDVELGHENIQKKRQADSCEWFFDDQFQTWKARENGVYCVFGNR